MYEKCFFLKKKEARYYFVLYRKEDDNKIQARKIKEEKNGVVNYSMKCQSLFDDDVNFFFFF